MKEILSSGFAEMGIPVPNGALDRLEAYWHLLDEKNKVMNLTAIKGEEDCARLHFLDCGALLRYVDLAGKTCLDVGSGAGFPGLVLKILQPEVKLTLLDSLGKRVEFQKEVVAALGLTDVECVNARAEECPERRESYDVVTSRAVARLNMLSELCLPFVKKGGTFAAMKGPAAAEELREAEKALKKLGGGEGRIVEYAVPGTDAVHCAVLVPKTGRTPPQYPRRWAAIKKAPL